MKVIYHSNGVTIEREMTPAELAAAATARRSESRREFLDTLAAQEAVRIQDEGGTPFDQ